MSSKKLKSRRPLRRPGRKTPSRTPRASAREAGAAGKKRPRKKKKREARTTRRSSRPSESWATRRSTRCSTGRDQSLIALAPGRRRPLLQPHRVVRRRRHQGHEHRRVPRPARTALHRRRSARALPRAGQGAREEDLRLPRHPDAVLRDLLSGQARPLARHRVSADREADLRGRLDRHRHELGRGQRQGADGADRLHPRGVRLARR